MNPFNRSPFEQTPREIELEQENQELRKKLLYLKSSIDHSIYKPPYTTYSDYVQESLSLAVRGDLSEDKTGYHMYVKSYDERSFCYYLSKHMLSERTPTNKMIAEIFKDMLFTIAKENES